MALVPAMKVRRWGEPRQQLAEAPFQDTRASGFRLVKEGLHGRPLASGALFRGRIGVCFDPLGTQGLETARRVFKKQQRFVFGRGNPETMHVV